MIIKDAMFNKTETGFSKVLRLHKCDFVSEFFVEYTTIYSPTKIVDFKKHLYFYTNPYTGNTDKRIAII